MVGGKARDIRSRSKALAAMKIASKIKSIERPDGAKGRERIDKTAGGFEACGFQDLASKRAPDIIQIAAKNHGCIVVRLLEHSICHESLELKHSFITCQPEMKVEEDESPLVVLYP